MGGNVTDATGAGASSFRGEVNLYDQFGSVLLLQGLYDLWPNWYLWETWGNHKFEVQRILRELADFLPVSRDPATRVKDAKGNSVHPLQGFLSQVENELVPYLQSESDLASSFQNYLRRPQHSWKEFFEMKLKVSESDLCFVGEHVKREVCEDFEFLVRVLLENKPPHAPENTDRHTHIGKYTRQRYVPCAVSAAWVKGKCNADGFAHHLLPRFYLLQALFDKQAILASTYKTPALQDKMFREISGLLALIRDAAAQSPDSVSQVVDRFVVPYLQLESELAKLLTDYLPKRHQSWKAFIDSKLSVEEKGFFGFSDDSPDDTVQLELSNACKFLLEEFELKHGFHSRLHAYFPHIISDLEFTEVDVFYATDRLVTEDGEYIGQHSKSRTWRKGNELHYGRITVGVPYVKQTILLENPENTREDLEHILSAVEPGVRILSMDTTLQDDQGGFMKMINQLADEACTYPLITKFQFNGGFTNRSEYSINPL